MTDTDLSLAIKALARSQSLDTDMIEGAFRVLLAGEADPVQIGAFMMGLAVRGETGAELVAGARVLRANARNVHVEGDVLDTCGTGGLPWTSLNTSTASAIVVAAAGGTVAKHGNRSVPPKTGSADVLEALGVELDLTEARFRDCIAQARIGFMFARSHHSAMRHVGPARHTLGIRTIFNLLGPLSNPARATHQVLGVNDAKWLEPMALALRDLGIKRAWIVHGQDAETGGVDEVSIAGPTQVIEVSNQTLNRFEVVPADAGIDTAPLSSLQGGTVDENALAIRELLEGREGPFRDAVVLNAAAGLLVLGLVSDLKDGAAIAAAAIDNGNAMKTLSTLVAASNGPPI